MKSVGVLAFIIAGAYGKECATNKQEITVATFNKNCLDVYDCCAFNAHCKSACCSSESLRCVPKPEENLDPCIKWGNIDLDIQDTSKW